MPPRVVIDTNVFTAAPLSAAGANRRVLRACLAETRFRAFAARASVKKGLALLDKLDAALSVANGTR